VHRVIVKACVKVKVKGNDGGVPSVNITFVPSRSQILSGGSKVKWILTDGRMDTHTHTHTHTHTPRAIDVDRLVSLAIFFQKGRQANTSLTIRHRTPGVQY
jgi:hypothetical protein